MVFQNAPTPLNWIIFAVIGWVIGQPDGKPILLHKVDDALHELGTSAVVLRSVIKIEHQRGDVSKALPHRLPPALKAIYHTITRHFGGDPIQKEFIQGREKDADRSHRRRRLEVVVGGLRWDAALPTPRERPHFDRRFRIEREP